MTLSYIMRGMGFAGENVNLTQFFCEEGIQVACLGIGAAIAEGDLQYAWDILQGPAWACCNELFDFWVVYGWINPPVWMAFAHYWLAAQSMLKQYGNKILARDAEFDENMAQNQDKISNRNAKNNTLRMLDSGATLSEIKKTYKTDLDNERFLNNYTSKFGLSEVQGFWNDIEQFTLYSEMTTRISIIKRFNDEFRGNELPGTRLYNGNQVRTNTTGATKKQLAQVVSILWQQLNLTQKKAYLALPGGNNYYGYGLLYERYYGTQFDLQHNYEPPAYGFKQIGDGEPSGEIVKEIKDNQIEINMSSKPILHGSYRYEKGPSEFDPLGIIEMDTGYFYVLKDFNEPLRLQLHYSTKQISDYLIATEGKKGDIIKTLYFPIKEKSTQALLNGYWQHLIEVDTREGDINIRYPDKYKGGGKIYCKTIDNIDKTRLIMKRAEDEITTWDQYSDAKGLLLAGATIEDGLRNMYYSNEGYGSLTLLNKTPQESCKDEYIDVHSLNE